MKAIRIEQFVEDYDELQVTEVAKPQVKDGELLVKVEAAGVNFADLLYARGKHQNNRSIARPPFTLGLEFAGTVISAPSTSKYEPGDRVFGGGAGAYAQYIAASEKALRLIPKTWSFASAAGLAATAPTSYCSLIFRARLKPGETVLVHAAAGGLGLMAVQIAKAVGAKVIGTAGSKEKLEVAKRFGADEVVNYDDGEWWNRVLELTDGKGVDVVYDPVGLVDKSLKCLQHTGRVLIIGFAGTEGKIEKIAMNRVLLRQAQIIGYRFGETERRNPEETIKAWKALNDLVEKKLLKPTVFEKEYKGLQSVVGAMKDLGGRKVWGKAVILVEMADSKAKL